MPATSSPTDRASTTTRRRRDVETSQESMTAPLHVFLPSVPVLRGRGVWGEGGLAFRAQSLTPTPLPPKWKRGGNLSIVIILDLALAADVQAEADFRSEQLRDALDDDVLPDRGGFRILDKDFRPLSWTRAKDCRLADDVLHAHPPA